MILDSICNTGLYKNVSPLLEKAFNYISSTDLLSMEDGRYEIDGDNIFVMVARRELKKQEDALLEVHDKYIDIQVVLSGNETFGWSDRAKCTAPRGKFDPEKDILFYEDKPATYFTLFPGELAVFFPGDAHAPLVGSGSVKKAIVKVLVK